MDSVEEYARKLAKQEEVELDALSEWVKSVKHHLKRRIYMISRSVNTKLKSTLDNPVYLGIWRIYMTILSSSQQIRLLTI